MKLQPSAKASPKRFLPVMTRPLLALLPAAVHPLRLLTLLAFFVAGVMLAFPGPVPATPFQLDVRNSPHQVVAIIIIVCCIFRAVLSWIGRDRSIKAMRVLLSVSDSAALNTNKDLQQKSFRGRFSSAVVIAALLFALAMTALGGRTGGSAFWIMALAASVGTEVLSRQIGFGVGSGTSTKTDMGIFVVAALIFVAALVTSVWYSEKLSLFSEIPRFELWAVACFAAVVVLLLTAGWLAGWSRGKTWRAHWAFIGQGALLIINALIVGMVAGAGMWLLREKFGVSSSSVWNAPGLLLVVWLTGTVLWRLPGYLAFHEPSDEIRGRSARKPPQRQGAG